MKKITAKQVEELARQALAKGNPYIKMAVKYMMGGKPMFLYANEKMTKEDIDKAYMETAAKDIKWGYEQRGVGYYDKWYRYNRADEGRAYDLGVRLAAETAGCRELFDIIECAYT